MTGVLHKAIIFAQLSRLRTTRSARPADRRVLNLIGQYLRRTAERGGLYWESERGIALGCALSPLIGAFFLNRLDEHMERLDLFYVRFMDDVLVLAPTRWKLRRAVRLLNHVLGGLQLDKHPDKTFIGPIQRGFDFLGYRFSPSGLAVAASTMERFAARAARLYEQERRKRQEPRARRGSSPSTLGTYVRRWQRWVSSGLSATMLQTDLSLVSTGRWNGRRCLRSDDVQDDVRYVWSHVPGHVRPAPTAAFGPAMPTWAAI
jgi:hypothetical protein